VRGICNKRRKHRTAQTLGTLTASVGVWPGTPTEAMMPSMEHTFFVADYGITVENAPNAVFAWQGTILHGTSLPKVRPGDLGTDFRQCGLGFAMSRQLGKLLERFGTGTSTSTSTSTSTTAVPVEINGEQELFVDAVWDSRMNGGELEYLIKWTGEDEPGREPAVECGSDVVAILLEYGAMVDEPNASGQTPLHLFDTYPDEMAIDDNELEAIDRFHEAYPNKPGPLSEKYEDEMDTDEE
jgi:hypothetical protein